MKKVFEIEFKQKQLGTLIAVCREVYSRWEHNSKQIQTATTKSSKPTNYITKEENM